MRVIVIGGTGTIGKEVVAKLAERHDVLTGGRSTGDFVVDIMSPDAIRRLFEATGQIDAVVCAAGEAVFKPLDEMTDEDFAFGFSYKLMGQTNLVRIGQKYLRDRGSFTLTSGATSRRPMAGSTGYSMVNAGVEGFARAAALDLPRGIRINAVSPEWTTTTLQLYGMDPGRGVPAEQVALGYVESVEGTRTGTVIDAGWTYDWAVDSLSVGAAEAADRSGVAV
jgi:NAD(P)-dependent dehydrogenase (short-subunit alcohol dehydrogenase family)